ncbi:hypothetical protein MWU54_06445 [Marivita sp. S6314]|uniref:hypothetical protein n=1 Tax=Marivita sp. S6314 TaxID=2926406 RepID=UPI001FF5CFEF|nr:hypothetical protein [Marivita sp. S6314]MCK0149654.1 hypothetical protein [Marivita sp. S6314]
MSGDNSTVNILVTCAAFQVEYALEGKISMAGGALSKGGAAGLLVQPVVWAVTGSGPDAADAFIYGTGVAGAFAGAILAIPAMATGVVKAGMDDYIGGLVEEARQDELAEVRGGIYGTDDYGFWAANNSITAMTIASKGGVAWKHPNGAYCFIKDASDTLICDFRPKKYTEIFRPILPLKLNGDKVLWTGSDY